MTTETTTLTAKQDKIAGFWRIRANGKTVGALVQPTYAVALGMLPTADDVRTAVSTLNPKMSISADTNVVICENR